MILRIRVYYWKTKFKNFPTSYFFVEYTCIGYLIFMLYFNFSLYQGRQGIKTACENLHLHGGFIYTVSCLIT